MIIKHIEQHTRILGAPKDWDESSDLPVGALPIRDVVMGGVPFMVSAWEPTPQEVAALLRGETVKIWIQGVSHPVIALSVGEVNELPDL